MNYPAHKRRRTSKKRISPFAMRRALERETDAAGSGLQPDGLSIQVVFDAPNNRKSAEAAQVLLDASAAVDLANLREKIVADLSYLTDLRETIAKDIEVLANLRKMTATDLTKLADLRKSIASSLEAAIHAEGMNEVTLKEALDPHATGFKELLMSVPLGEADIEMLMNERKHGPARDSVS